MASDFGFPAYSGTETHAFISYKKVNEERVAKYAKALHDRGLNIWYDQLGNTGIKLTSNWKKSISVNLTYSSAVIAFVSRDFFSSPGFMMDELNFSLDNSPDNLIIVLLDEISRSDVSAEHHMLLHNIKEHQCLEAYNMEFDTVIDQLYACASDLLANESRNISGEKEAFNKGKSFKHITIPSSSGSKIFQKYKGWVIGAVAAVAAVAALALLPGLKPETPEPPEIPTAPVDGAAFDPNANYQEGDIFTMGTFEQDNDLDNGAEPIEWRVLKVEGNRALVLSQYGLIYRPVHDKWESVTWEYTTIRTWLNGDFLYENFSADERQHIPETYIENNSNPKHYTSGGNDTYDCVFLLSYEEAEEYLHTTKDRQCAPTTYALEEARGRLSEDAVNALGEESDGWWLRTIGKSTDWNCRMRGEGTLNVDGAVVSRTYFMIRPAFYVDLY